MKLDLDYIEKATGLPILYFDEIDSTSLYCKRRIKERDPFVGAVIAGFQQNGQGRVGKSFYSPKDCGLYVTFSFEKSFLKNDDITPAIALAVCKSVYEIFGLECGVKWVNDVYLGGRKVAGVLCQLFDDFCLIGIGINLQKPPTIPRELVQRMGWLADAVDQKKRSMLIVSLYQNLLRCCREQNDSLLSEYRKRCVHIGKAVEIEFDRSLLRGKCVGISDDFSLLVEINGCTQSFSSGFMTLKI